MAKVSAHYKYIYKLEKYADPQLYSDAAVVVVNVEVVLFVFTCSELLKLYV